MHENDYPNGLDMEQFEHVESISSYNNNYYKGVKSGDLLFEQSDDDRTSRWYLIRNCQIFYLGESYLNYEMLHRNNPEEI